MNSVKEIPITVYYRLDAIPKGKRKPVHVRAKKEVNIPIISLDSETLVKALSFKAESMRSEVEEMNFFYDKMSGTLMSLFGDEDVRDISEFNRMDGINDYVTKEPVDDDDNSVMEIVGPFREINRSDLDEQIERAKTLFGNYRVDESGNLYIYHNEPVFSIDPEFTKRTGLIRGEVYFLVNPDEDGSYGRGKIFSRQLYNMNQSRQLCTDIRQALKEYVEDAGDEINDTDYGRKVLEIMNADDAAILSEMEVHDFNMEYPEAFKANPERIVRMLGQNYIGLFVNNSGVTTEVKMSGILDDLDAVKSMYDYAKKRNSVGNDIGNPIKITNASYDRDVDIAKYYYSTVDPLSNDHITARPYNARVMELEQARADRALSKMVPKDTSPENYFIIIKDEIIKADDGSAYMVSSRDNEIKLYELKARVNRDFERLPVKFDHIGNEALKYAYLAKKKEPSSASRMLVNGMSLGKRRFDGSSFIVYDVVEINQPIKLNLGNIKRELSYAIASHATFRVGNGKEVERTNLTEKLKDQLVYQQNQMRFKAEKEANRATVKAMRPRVLDGVLAGSVNIMGDPIEQDQVDRIQRFMDNPTEENWDNISTISVSGMDTVWSSWVNNDSSAPRTKSGDTWGKIPTPEDIAKALCNTLGNELPEKYRAQDKGMSPD